MYSLLIVFCLAEESMDNFAKSVDSNEEIRQLDKSALVPEEDEEFSDTGKANSFISY